METVRTISDVRKAVAQARKCGRTVGLVPTMGALHAGHASLIDAARSACGLVVVSIFVNPTQFGPREDLAAYPRTPQADAALCEAHGADLIFAPSVQEMYPSGAALVTRVSVDELAGVLCGRSRPGHFAGVCTVVAKLFNVVQPDQAFFGAKDYQQAAIVRRMAADLDFAIRVVICPTVRESDGLAMSSRNAYLTPAQRLQAPALHESLALAQRLVAQGRRSPAAVIEAMRQHIAERAPDGVIDYVSIVDPDTLRDVDTIDRPVLAVLAVALGRARLIDNMVVDCPRPNDVQ